MKIIARTFSLFALLIFSGSALADNNLPGLSLGSVAGRFAFGQMPGSSLSTNQLYMVDTQTGRLWKLHTDPDGTVVLLPIRYRASDTTEYALPPEPDKVPPEKKASK